MASNLVTKQHDTKIHFSHIPTIDGVVVPPADFAGCTVKFLLKSDDTAIPAIIQTATINPDGTFGYDPVAGDVDTIGKYRQEWEVTYPNNKILTFPNNGYNSVKIIFDLG